MSLLKQFIELKMPSDLSSKIFNASTLENYPFAKIGINHDGFPVILISSFKENVNLTRRNVRLKYLELTHNLECKVTENGISHYNVFSIIIFKSNQNDLQFYFFGIAETLLQSLSINSTETNVFESFNKLIEVFRALSDSPSKTLQGLWTELFLIERSKEPRTLIHYWHDRPEEKFDFNAGKEKVEVKSSSSLERIHIFSAEQLDPPEGELVLIASIFVKHSSNGYCVTDLLESIQRKVSDPRLTQKLLSTVLKTLGNSIEQSIKIKYDYTLAVDSLKYYNHQDVSKIERINIPSRVSSVKYKTDLTGLDSIDPIRVLNEGLLFKAL